MKFKFPVFLLYMNEEGNLEPLMLKSGDSLEQAIKAKQVFVRIPIPCCLGEFTTWRVRHRTEGDCDG